MIIFIYITYFLFIQQNRKKELPASCKLLGIEDVMIVDDPRLPDGMNTKWDASVISNFISENVKNQLKQNENVNELVIYTFDEFGISNHANHISTHFGVKQFLSNPNLPTDLKKINAFKLETTNIVRKYLGLLDLPISNLFLSKNEKLYFTTTFIQSFKAMQQHHSQFVWFRYLFVLFSRYGFVNTLLPIEFNNK